MSLVKAGFTYCVFIALCVIQYSIAEETFCAKVKIEILQELTLERQGFEATMRITNGLDTFSLEDVAVDIVFQDEDENPVVATSDPNASSADFFIRLDGTDNISGLAQLEKGSIAGGSVAPASAAEIKWLIVPVPGAAKNNPTGKLYFVGAKLRYSYGGQQDEVVVAPDTIIVKPQPKLTLDYFLTEHVFGDDAFTDVIEPIVPYTLGIRIANNGFGTANNVKLDSAQPRIIENKQGLSIGFNIAGSYVNDAPAEPSLLLNFGDIPASGRTMGRWIMETTLSGRFTEFSASVSHAAEFGGELTSLIEGANTHFLIRNVQVDAAGRDGLQDFLAYEAGEGADANKLWVFESENLGIERVECDDCSPVFRLNANLSSAVETGNGTQHTLSPASLEPGFVFIKISDPYNGEKSLSRTIRQDGRQLLEANAWLGKERNEDKINFDHFIYIFDQQVTGDYTLLFSESAMQPQPPVIQFISDKTTFEGDQVGFLVRASDMNGDLVNVTVKSLPLGAMFDYESGQSVSKGIFNWYPQFGQAGSYPVTFVANDGQFTTEFTVTIKVNSASDTDGDGLPDDWEIEHFGDLSRDGKGDYDKDGYSDFEEWQKGWNPKEAAKVPNVPTIKSPAYDGEVESLTPELVIENSRHSADIEVTYTWEVYADSAMTERVALFENVTEDIDFTKVQLQTTEGGESFKDNHLYFWRVRGVAIEGSSEWAVGQFFINTTNDAPDTPQLRSPEHQGLVSEAKPILSVSNVIDVDRDAVKYTFKLFPEKVDINSDEPLFKIEALDSNENGITQWQIPEALSEDVVYQWMVTATDEHGLETQSEVRTFRVSTTNHMPSAPVIQVLANQSEVENLSVDLIWLNGEDPEALPLTYVLEWDTQADFNSGSQQLIGNISEGAEESSVAISLAISDENKTIYWRVKASDGELHSAWAQGQFILNTVNEAPSEPTVSNPAQNATVEVLQPTLSVNASVDSDADAITYDFEVYSDESLSHLFANASVGETSWVVPVVLTDNQNYYWRVKATDEHGLASSWSDRHQFFANNGGVDDEPQFSFVLPASNIELTDGDVLIQWTDNDPDSNANITLWYEGDNGEINTIVTDLQEDADGEGDKYTWHVSDLPVGNYLVKAVVTDDSNRIDVTAAGKVSVVPNEGHILPTLQTSNLIDESGEAIAQIDVVLDRAPRSGESVTVNIGVSDSTEARIVRVEQNAETKASNYLYFTEQNWNQPYSIFVKGLDDCEVDGNKLVDLVLSKAVSGDTGFNGVDPQDITLSNQDDEDANQSLFMCGYETITQKVVGDRIHATLKGKLKNTGNEVYAVQAKLNINNANYRVEGSDELFFRNVKSSALTNSLDAFTISYDKNVSFDASVLKWETRVVQANGNQLPAGWKGDNIGWVWKKGGVSVSNGDYKVNGSGADIWALADGFYFVHRELDGDGEIIAQINRLDNTHKWAKAGVMIRESTWTGSKHAFLLMTPNQGVDFQYRTTTSWATHSKGLNSAGMGTWLRLVRSGYKFTAYMSSDMTNWTKVGEQNISMNQKVRVGLAVTSHHWFKRTTAEFDSVWVED